MPDVSILERAWDCLSQEKPGSALRILNARIPKEAACERDFLAAEAWRAMGYFSKAEAFYWKVLRRSSAGQDLCADSALGMAAINRSLGRVARARKFLRLARRCSKSLSGDYPRRLELEDALIDRGQGLYSKCLTRLTGLLAAFKAEQDFASAAFVLWAMGGARRFSGDFAGSRRDFEQSLAYARRAARAAAASKSAQAYAFLGLGGVSRVAGRPGDSKRFYARAARLLSGTQDIFGQAYAECGLANALRQAGDYAQAQARYRRAYQLYSSLGDKVDLAYVDWGLGQVALHLGDAKAARQKFARALAEFVKAGETRGVVISRQALAYALHAAGRTKPAETLFNQALASSRRAKIYAHLEALT